VFLGSFKFGSHLKARSMMKPFFLFTKRFLRYLPYIYFSLFFLLPAVAWPNGIDHFKFIFNPETGNTPSSVYAGTPLNVSITAWEDAGENTFAAWFNGDALRACPKEMPEGKIEKPR